MLPDCVSDDSDRLLDVWVFFAWVYHLIALQWPSQKDDRLIIVPLVADAVGVERAAPSCRFFSVECYRDPSRQLRRYLGRDG